MTYNRDTVIKSISKTIEKIILNDMHKEPRCCGLLYQPVRPTNNLAHINNQK